MKHFNVEITKETLISNGGLLLLFKYLREELIDYFLCPTLSCGNPSYHYTDQEILRVYFALLFCGHSSYESVDLYKDCPFFKSALDLEVIPSKERLRQRMDIISTQDPEIFSKILELNHYLLKELSIPSVVSGYDFVPLDFDVSIFDNTDSSKQGVKKTYQKGVEGYAPMFAYLGHQGFLLNQQFRGGNFHSNCEGSLAFFIETIKRASEITDKQLLARFDSGNDAMINAVHFANMEGVNFIIKRNIRSKQSRPRLIEEVLNNYSFKADPQAFTSLYHYEKEVLVKYYEKEIAISADIRQVYSVVEIRADKNGQLLLEPKYEIHSWWTDLEKEKYPLEEIIALYKDHATCEQFHSEFKSELDIEKMPSGKFLTNELIVSMAQVTFNIIRFIGEEALASNTFPLKRKVSRLKIKTVINKLLRLPAKFIIKNKINTIKIPRLNPFTQTFNWIYLNANFI